METPIAKLRRQARKAPYDPEPLLARLQELLKERNESYREASLAAGLDHQAVNRMRAGHRPQMHICILMADHFGINPNELLELAGWPALKALDVRQAAPENLPPEAVDVALDIARIPNPATRKQVCEAIRTLLKQYILTEE